MRIALAQPGVGADRERRHPAHLLGQPAEGGQGLFPALLVGVVGPGEEHDVAQHARHPVRPDHDGADRAPANPR